ncbi:MAG: hypothetical protein WCF67_12505 [Chitinophagaceae bacterium]
MKKWLIGSLVGALLLFIWQFISWAAAGLHDPEYKYHPQQEQIMSSLSSLIKEDGQYMMPRTPPDATSEQQQAAMKEMNGKPFAVISYKSSYEIKMAEPMIRGFLADVVIALLMIYVLGKRTNFTVGSVWAASLAIGFIGWLWHPYTENIWFQTPVAVLTGALMDWFVAYTILGLWLGWWLKRSSRVVSR